LSNSVNRETGRQTDAGENIILAEVKYILIESPTNQPNTVCQSCC